MAVYHSISTFVNTFSEKFSEGVISMGIPHYNKYRQYPPDDNKHCCGCNTVVMGNVIFVIAIFLMIFKACSN